MEIKQNKLKAIAFKKSKKSQKQNKKDKREKNKLY